MTRTIITGYGVFTAFGYGTDVLKQGIFFGNSAFAEVQRFDTSSYHARYAAEYGASAPSQLEVLRECLNQALSMSRQVGRDAPVLIGTGGDHAANRQFWSLDAEDKTSRRELDVSCSLAGAIPDILGREFDLGPLRIAFVNGCVASTSAITYGCQLINSGRADTVICGGSYVVNEDMFGKFDSGRALTTDTVARPFSAGRQGLLQGDGAAILVLESDKHARMRRASSFGEIVGWGLTADAHHPVQPHPQGVGLAAAAQAALKRATLSPEQIGYVNAHGTGTLLNDSAESLAMHRVFGPRGSKIPISSTKGATGHMLEASGAVEAIITLISLSEGFLPPTLNFLGADPACDVDCIPNVGRQTSATHALSLNAAFGGANAALVLAGPE